MILHENSRVFSKIIALHPHLWIRIFRTDSPSSLIPSRTSLHLPRNRVTNLENWPTRIEER